MIELIDLCPTLQKPVDWRAVAGAGFRGAIIKASQYSSTRIWKFKEYADAARGAGLVPGAYHFAYVGADPVKQAQFFFSASAGTGSQPGEMPPVLDLEFAQPNVPGKDIVQWGEAFMEEAVRLWYPDNRLLSPGDYRYRLPMLYSYPHFLQRLMPWLGGSKLLAFPLHIASYRSKWDPVGKKHVLIPWKPDLQKDKPLIPNGTWPTWTIWQYSGNNGLRVPGIPVDCDRNVFRGSNSDWDWFCGRGVPATGGNNGGPGGVTGPVSGHAASAGGDMGVGNGEPLGGGPEVLSGDEDGKEPARYPRAQPGGTASSKTVMK